MHYAFLFNLDSREITEIWVHRFGSGADELGVVRDPHTDVLKAEFAAKITPPESRRWELCLRGNHRRTKYNAIIVDFPGTADAGKYWVRRTHLACAGSQDKPEQRFPDFLPLMPPKMPPPGSPPEDEFPPPPMNPNPPMQPSTPVGPFTPVSPWPFPGPEYDDPPETGEDDADGSMENPSIPVPSCSPTEVGAIIGKIEDLEMALAAARAARDGDLMTFAPFRWEWVDEAMFNDDCLQNLNDQFNMQVQELKIQSARHWSMSFRCSPMERTCCARMPAYAGCSSFLQYLMMLISANC